MKSLIFLEFISLKLNPRGSEGPDKERFPADSDVKVQYKFTYIWWLIETFIDKKHVIL